MLLTILSLVAASVLSLQYMQRRLVLCDVAKVKAEYAAQSGAAGALARLNDVGSVTAFFKGERQHFAFADGSQADVETGSWGVYLLVRATGTFAHVRTFQAAIAGMRPSPAYDNALVLGNVNHQLVLTGSSFIKGDILIGPPGVTTGSLRDYATPISLPHDGKTVTKKTPDLPPVERTLLQDFSDSMGDLFRGHGQGSPSTGERLTTSYTGDVHLRAGVIPDTVDIAFILGDAVIDGAISRRDRPLYIVARGNTEMSQGARIEGLVMIAGTGVIAIEPGAYSRHVVLYSETKIHLLSGASFSGQLIAPVITCDSGSVARYPSCLVSLSRALGPDSSRTIVVSNGARVEGTVCLFAGAALPGKEDILQIDPSAQVIGTVYSAQRTTLDGSVVGSVITGDFYFYSAPTSYIGWLRSGRIDRADLPKNLLLPPAMTDFRHADILEWL